MAVELEVEFGEPGCGVTGSIQRGRMTDLQDKFSIPIGLVG